MSALKPYADLKYKSREYEDKETGKMKGVWLTVGTLFSSPHGSNMSIKLDCVPVGDEWNGWLSVFPRERQAENKESDDKLIDLSEIPF